MRIFVSYSRVDKPFTERFVTRLRRMYRSDEVWYDDELLGGDVWWEEILDQIAACDIFIYLLSNESVNSPYCQAEFAEARRLQKRIITVQVRDRTKMVGELNDIQYVDMKAGIDNADALEQLTAAVNKQAGNLPTRRPKALWTPRTSRPKMAEEVAEGTRPEVETPPLTIENPNRPVGSASPPARFEEIITPQQPRRRVRWIVGLLAAVGLFTAGIGIASLLSNNNFAPQGTPNAILPTASESLTSEASSVPTTAPSATTSASNTPTTEPTVPSATILPSKTPTHQLTATFMISPPDTLTDTASATPTFTASPTPTGELTLAPKLSNTPIQPSIISTLSPILLASTPVNVNADWIPVIQNFGGVEMVLVPAGSFMMGSENGDEDEKPIHPQTFTTPFWIDRYEVTNAQYRECVEDTLCSLPAKLQYYESQAEIPAVYINWMQAINYCIYRAGRLPTEAEWEYAARGPDSLIYPWGNDFDTNKVIWQSNYPVPVGSRLTGASWVGALDMSGNVWEWVRSNYAHYPYVNDGRLEGITYDELQVRRGGSWYEDGAQLDGTFWLRSTVRGEYDRYSHGSHIGFRCVRDT